MKVKKRMKMQAIVVLAVMGVMLIAVIAIPFLTGNKDVAVNQTQNEDEKVIISGFEPGPAPVPPTVTITSPVHVGQTYTEPRTFTIDPLPCEGDGCITEVKLLISDE